MKRAHASCQAGGGPSLELFRSQGLEGSTKEVLDPVRISQLGTGSTGPKKSTLCSDSYLMRAAYSELPRGSSSSFIAVTFRGPSDRSTRASLVQNQTFRRGTTAPARVP